MQIASLLNHELPERWPQADCDGTARKGMSPVGRVSSWVNGQATYLPC